MAQVMNGAALTLSQVSYTNKAFWRNPASAFFTFAFPLMFLVIFTALLGHGTVHISPTKVVNLSTYYVAAMATFGVITACYNNIAITVSFQRDQGILKRTNGTPLPGSIFLGARMVHALLVAVLLVVITAGFGRAAYSASIPTGLTLLRFLVVLVVGAAAFCALGMAITAVIPNADAAPAIVNASILPLLFLSGVFIPLGSNAPAWIVWIARIFPVWHFAKGMQAGFLGTAFSWTDVLVVAAWGPGRPAARDPVLQLGAADLDRIAATSYRAMPVATPAFSDSVAAAIGIRTSTSQAWATIRDRPRPSDPVTRTSGAVARSRSRSPTSPAVSRPATKTPASR
jgi:ABC-2 type transport system permease protein